MAAIAMQCINICILALGLGQRLLYRLGSGLGLVLVLVCAYCSACADLCDSGPESHTQRHFLTLYSRDVFVVSKYIVCFTTFIHLVQPEYDVVAF